MAVITAHVTLTLMTVGCEACGSRGTFTRTSGVVAENARMWFDAHYGPVLLQLELEDRLGRLSTWKRQ